MQIDDEKIIIHHLNVVKGDDSLKVPDELINFNDWALSEANDDQVETIFEAIGERINFDSTKGIVLIEEKSAILR